MTTNPLFLTADVRRRAASVMSEMIKFMLANKLATRSDLHVVVLDPFFDFSDRSITAATIPESSIIYEESFGDISKWESDFKMLARTKALTAARRKMSTSELKLTSNIFLLEEGDAYMTGGVYKYGLAIGVSGVEGCLDEMIGQNYANCFAGFANQFKEIYIKSGKNIL